MPPVLTNKDLIGSSFKNSPQREDTLPSIDVAIMDKDIRSVESNNKKKQLVEFPKHKKASAIKEQEKEEEFLETNGMQDNCESLQTPIV